MQCWMLLCLFFGEIVRPVVERKEMEKKGGEGLLKMTGVNMNIKHG